MKRSFGRVTKLIGAYFLFAAAACATDAPSATAPQATLLKAPPVPGSFGVTSPTSILEYQDTVTAIFTVDPAVGANVQIGNHQIYFPASTICDPSMNTYGPTEWTKPCVVTSTPVTITAVSWIDATGHPQIDFSPAMRFRVNGGGELPTLYLRDADASLQSWSSINYCTHQGTSCEDEAQNNADLATRRDPSTGFLYRYIRHFSGYNVWA